jgi:ketosteroid isomerase-like protein
MNRAKAIKLLERLHHAQNVFYAGGPSGPLAALLAPAITWTVPGRNPIAGTYHGVDEVLGYFARRRDIAGRTFQLTRRDVLVGEGDNIAALTDGSATIGGAAHHWSTVGLYRAVDERIVACWLLPLDQNVFDAIWSA